MLLKLSSQSVFGQLNKVNAKILILSKNALIDKRTKRYNSGFIAVNHYKLMLFLSFLYSE